MFREFNFEESSFAPVVALLTTSVAFRAGSARAAGNLAISERPAARLLEQASWGPTPLAFAEVRPLQSAFFANALSGQDQLRQRVTFALSEIWVVSAVQLNLAYAFPSYYKLVSDNAFANYRDIVKAVTLSPAMGVLSEPARITIRAMPHRVRRRARTMPGS